MMMNNEDMGKWLRIGTQPQNTLKSNIMTTIKLTMKSQVYVPPSTELKVLEEKSFLESPHYRAMHPEEVF